MHKKVEKIVNLKSCLGCGLCLSKDSQGRMEMGTDGFLRPSKDATIDSNFTKYCPGLLIEQTRQKNGMELIYGPTVAPIIVGWSTNDDIHYKASSGGVITSLLIELLKANLVDAILHVRQSSVDSSRTEPHLSKTVDEIIECMGSRYAPCSLFKNFHKYLETENRIAVVGKPCDIAALKAFLKIHPEYEPKIKYTFSMMCMGLPSHNATKKMIEFLGAKGKELSLLRYRGYGWPGMATVESEDGYKKECTYIESWGAILGRDTLFRCKLCPNGFGEFADVSCGDAWYCKDGQPSFENTSNGRSFIFMRTQAGKDIVERAVADGLIESESYDLNEMPIIQVSQYQRKVNLLGRYIIFKILVNHSFRIKGFHLFKLARIAGIFNLKKDARGFFGRYWRDYKGKKR